MSEAFEVRRPTEIVSYPANTVPVNTNRNPEMHNKLSDNY